MSDFWSACLSQFEQELSSQQFNTWIKALRMEDEGDHPRRLRLLAPNRFVLQWVRERYFGQIEALSREFYGESVNLSLGLCDPSQLDKADIDDAGLEEVTEGGDSGQEALANGGSRNTNTLLSSALDALITSSAPSASFEKTRLNPTFTFDTLVTGRANDLARAAAQQVAMNPGVSYNPLFVYGGVGLGKTHLIHAIGNAVLAANPNAQVRYLHAEDFVSDVVKAYQNKAFDAFKRYYRTLDLLLIDDIQFFSGKNSTQEQFFYAFNALVEAKKQIIITCDTYPKDIQGLENRLISRFDWGLTVQIEPPELEMRVAIVKKKAEASRIDICDDVAFLIAKNLRSNVRELEGALNRVLAFARFHGKPINIDVAKEALKDVIGATNRQITLELIQKTVADFYKIKVAEMYSPKRTRAIARPRQVAMWLCRELTAHSLPEIGDAFGGRDHTTVLHACRTIVDHRVRDAQLNNDLHVLLQTIKG
ncbi:MAG TPA: chromosomal replication initiator protein DnaA [Rhodocyclaceae bacterium]|jgi:chromosomal replication initiator protein